MGTFGQLDSANISRDEILKVASVLDGHLQGLLVEGELDLSAAGAFAAALKGDNVELAGLVDNKIPADPVILFGPVADGVFVGLGLIADGGAVDNDVFGVKENGAVVGLGDGF